MREPPSISIPTIRAGLSRAYGLTAAQIDFLPIGADVNTAVYRVTTPEGAAWFLKLRSGTFEPASVLAPLHLYENGVRQVIPVMRALDGRAWAQLDGVTSILYPFVEGVSGWHKPLTPPQWADFGQALRRIHSLALPPELQDHLPRETYSPYWRDLVTRFQAQVETQTFVDPLAAQMADLMRAQSATIRQLVGRAADLANILQAAPPPEVLCHADLHAGNLLLAEDGQVYIVDWDNPILAPKERDLMFIGAGIGDLWNTPEEQGLFSHGYGTVPIHAAALAYYRYERIVEDLAAFSQEILPTSGESLDRQQGLHFFASQFEDNGVIAMAHRAYALYTASR